jgi:hypothetical protein
MQPDGTEAGTKPMKMRHPWMAALAALLLLLALPAFAQFEDYRYRPGKAPVGRVLHYVKSQRDGSHESLVSVYVPAAERVESLKWERGGTQATLVVATMDWSVFSVREFEAWGLAKDAAGERRATLTVNGDELRMSLMPDALKLTHWPWHSYDFDFTSLTLTLPHRRHPRRDLSFWRTDFVYAEAPTVAELGELTLAFVREENRGGVRAWRYTLGGPGLQGQHGDWWVDARTGLTIEYELPVGDEPGYADVRFRLESSAAMTPAQWQAFKLAAVSGS